MSTNTKVSVTEVNTILESVEYRYLQSGKSTICEGVYKNAFGEFVLGRGFSSCVDPANYDQVIGETIALKNAQKVVEDKVWELKGWELFCKLGSEASIKDVQNP